MTNSRFILMVLVLAVLASILIVGFFQPDLATLRGWIMSLSAWRNGYPVTTGVAFFVVYLSATALSLPLGMWLSLTAGALFGFPAGVAMAVMASALGATIAMWGARHFLRDRLHHWLNDHPAAQQRRWVSRIQRGFARDGWLYLLSLRMLPIIPFFIINLAMGLTAMSTRVFFLVTLIGLLPLTSIFVWTGTRLARVQRPADLVSVELIASLGLLAALPWLARFLVGALRRVPKS